MYDMEAWSSWRRSRAAAAFSCRGPAVKRIYIYIYILLIYWYYYHLLLQGASDLRDLGRHLVVLLLMISSYHIACYDIL